MSRQKPRMLRDAALVRRAAVDAIVKLDPRKMMRNPVMFVVEVGSIITLVDLIHDAIAHRASLGSRHLLFEVQITLWLWFTVLFANFAEAMAEGRGKAQADALRRAKSDTTAHLIQRGAKPLHAPEDVSSSLLRVGDVVVVSAGELIPGDGEVIQGVASVDESAITGESAPVIREAGGDRCEVGGAKRILQRLDQIARRVPG